MGLSDVIDTKSPGSSYSGHTQFGWFSNGCHEKFIYGCELTHNCIQKIQICCFTGNVVGLNVQYFIIYTDIHHEHLREAVLFMFR